MGSNARRSNAPEPRPNYAYKKLRKSLVVLATSSGSLRNRLGKAWVDEGKKAAGALPPGEFADRFDQLHMTLTGGSGVGSIRQSIDELSDQDVRDVAREIVALTLDLAAERG